jgi:hypothetical protein
VPRRSIIGRLYHYAERFYRWVDEFSPASKTLIALAFVVFAVLFAALPRVVTAEISHDDLNWVDRSLVPWWFPESRIMDKAQWSADYMQKYNYAINHPTVGRIVNRIALHALGMYDRPTHRWNYSLTRPENIKLGNVLPFRITIGLRMVNLAFFLATAVIIYFGLAYILRNRFLAVLGVLPIAFEPVMTADFRCVVPYIGADAVFVFLTVLVWTAWLALGKRGMWGALVLGILAGLAVSTKVNAAFLVAGLMLYYAFTARGGRRLVQPLVLLAASIAVFLALNPIYFGGGWPWAKRVLADTLDLMVWIKNDKTSAAWAVYTRRETILAAFPCILFAAPVAALAWQARRSAWLAPTLFWSVPVIVGNLLLIYMPDPRYSAPVRVAFLVLLSAVSLHVMKELIGEKTEGGPKGATVDAQAVAEASAGGAR